MVDSTNEYLNEKLHFEVTFNVPKISVEYEKWAAILVGRENWLDNLESKNLNSSLILHYTYIESVLQSYRLFCELVRLPIFDTPKVISLSEDTLHVDKYILKIESSLVNMVPHSVYITLNPCST